MTAAVPLSGAVQAKYHLVLVRLCVRLSCRHGSQTSVKNHGANDSIRFALGIAACNSLRNPALLAIVIKLHNISPPGVVVGLTPDRPCSAAVMTQLHQLPLLV